MRGRTRLLIIAGGCVVVVAVIVATLLTTSTGGAADQRPEYTSLPESCELLSAATLATYAPGASWTLRPTSPLYGASKTENCIWQAASGSLGPLISVWVSIFDSPDGVAKADRVSGAWNAGGTRSKGVTVQAVPGLGDQAVEVSAVTPPVAGSASRSLSLSVAKSNAVIQVGYDIMSPKNGLPENDPAQATQEVAIARDVLAILADPRLAAPVPRFFSPPPPVTSPAGPRYASPRDPCALVSAAVLAKQAPGATVVPNTSAPAGPGKMTACDWAVESTGESVFLSINVLPAAGNAFGSAEEEYESDVQRSEQTSTVVPGDPVTPTGTQPVADLGEQATACFQQEPNSPLGPQDDIDLTLWSGNAEMELTITYSESALPSRAAQVTAATGIARAALASLPRS